MGDSNTSQLLDLSRSLAAPRHRLSIPPQPLAHFCRVFDGIYINLFFFLTCLSLPFTWGLGFVPVPPSRSSREQEAGSGVHTMPSMMIAFRKSFRSLPFAIQSSIASFPNVPPLVAFLVRVEASPNIRRPRRPPLSGAGVPRLLCAHCHTHVLRLFCPHPARDRGQDTMARHFSKRRREHCHQGIRFEPVARIHVNSCRAPSLSPSRSGQRGRRALHSSNCEF